VSAWSPSCRIYETDDQFILIHTRQAQVQSVGYAYQKPKKDKMPTNPMLQRWRQAKTLDKVPITEVLMTRTMEPQGPVYHS
jgi:hypothetical protein